MVLDRNENHDYDDVVELLMLGEVKAHLKKGCLIDDNLKQVGDNISIFFLKLTWSIAS